MPANVIFIDTWLWVARLSRRDQSHESAIKVFEAHRSARLVTSDMVLTEFLNIFADEGEYLRNAAFRLVKSLPSWSNVIVVYQTPGRFDACLDRYGCYLDKEWSLTDCASMCIMDDMQISDVMTNDHHFVQAGYVVHN